ncbi:hypothetical protein LPJ66_000341 [Kickxella alabastrina]|uniref:Uncharacterized protein n=1 Tax=Kickxella alabastrina TaxID=61397 RepID=A0ACC1IWF0_9FUNG|nr:hypothetical protein LPJ66_000341 [Kickxella alabastrina]
MGLRIILTVATIAAAAVSTAAAAEVSTTLNTDVTKYSFNDANYTYCDPGYPQTQSYAAVPDAQLEFVQAVVRHGDRTPVHLIPNDETTWNCDGTNENMYLHSSADPKNTTGSVQQVIDIPAWNGKHGFSNQVWGGTCEVGQLTDHGKLQHRTLGSHLRDIYIDKLGFLPDKLTNPEQQVYARSTYIWRTKNSAESLLGSLWPDRGVLPGSAIKLHSLPQFVETMYGNADACPAIKNVLTLISKTDQYQRFLKDQGPLMAKLAGIFNVSGNRWSDTWDGYFDVLNARHCNSKDLPCSHALAGGAANNSAAKCATVEDVLQVQHNSHYELTYKMRDSTWSKQLMRLYIGSFIGTLKERMEQHVAGKAPELKFALYSGHDTTVLPLLAALRASNQGMLWPPYASNILFELWKKSDGSRVVRVIYNGEVLRLMEGSEWCDLNACPIDTFYKHLDEYIPSDIATECVFK